MATVLHLLADTSTWLDLAQRRDGQKWVVPIRQLVRSGDLELLVPEVLLHEFKRNRERKERAMSMGIAERFRLLRSDVVAYGGEDSNEALGWVDALAHRVPLIGAMTTRNFQDILDLLERGRTCVAGPEQYANVVQRGLDKRAPLHLSKNSVADALLVEIYAMEMQGSNLSTEPHAFVTSNHSDFSVLKGDRRRPHEDIADFFAADGSTYHLGVEGLIEVLRQHFSEEFEELVWESDFTEEPRRLDEILRAEQHFFNLISFDRGLGYRVEKEEDRLGRPMTPEEYQAFMDSHVLAAETRNPDLKLVESDFEWGMWNGKLSALRWVLGSDWDFLDT